jgi:vacuolar-type H+-ATPase subunit I/STV1
MKKVACSLLVLVSVSLTGCQNMKWGGVKKSRAKANQSYLTTLEEDREQKLRNVREITEPRAKTYERQGHSPEVARAMAEIEYYRSTMARSSR